MRCPSGDQDGDTSLSGLFVSRFTSAPSAFMVYISGFPSRLEVNAIRPGGVYSPAVIYIARPTVFP